MAKLYEYINAAYPQFSKYLSTHTLHETRQKYAHILPTIKADVFSFATENKISLNLDF